ncbi:MAG: hypothetical protein ABNH38_02540 [Tateyamaria sp.]|uniref:hypothetical protein n=1 Tax=Tateyamaria sp. TaxID=1929288 RepID=UPI0032DE1AC0
MEKWMPIKFEPDIEHIYAKHMLSKFIPLSRLAYGIGIIAFIGYGFWDLMLDPEALERTGPIRLIAVLHFLICIGLSFLQPMRRNPTYWPVLSVYVYCVYGFLFTLILSQLPGGFVAGVGGLILGMIFVPATTSGVRQAASMLGV